MYFSFSAWPCFSFLLVLIFFLCATALAAEKELDIQGKKLISQKPVFALNLPSEYRWIHSFSHENPGENSLTRVYLYVKEKNRQVEEMLIIQIADRTNPQADSMTVPPLRPYSEKRMYLRDRIKKGEVAAEYLIQTLVWNPGAPSLQSIVKKGLTIPSHCALQGQLLFNLQPEHAVLIRYSKDASAFGLKVSDKEEKWNKDALSGNEKKVYEAFHKTFLEMVHSMTIRTR